MALLKQRCKDDGLTLDDQTLQEQFRLHLHRGIGYLMGDPDVTDAMGLIGKAAGGCAPKRADA